MRFRSKVIGFVILVATLASACAAWLVIVGKRAVNYDVPGDVANFMMGNGPANGLAFSPNGELLAATGNSIRVWEISSGKEIANLTDVGGQAYPVVFLDEGSILAVGSFDSKIRLWETKGWTVQRVLDGRAGCVHCLTLSPDGKLLASGDKTVRLWSTVSWKQESAFKAKAKTPELELFMHVNGLAYSPKGDTLISSGPVPQAVIAWTVTTGTEIGEVHDDMPTGVAFCPKGDLFATGGTCVKLWRCEPLGEVAVLGTGLRVAADGLRFSPDGRFLASVGGRRNDEPGQLNLWDASTGSTVVSLRIPSTCLQSLAFSPKGDLLATGSLDGTVKLWRLQTILAHSQRN